MPRRTPPCIVQSSPRSDGWLSIVLVDWTRKVIVTSTGEELYSPYEKCLNLAAELCWEQAAVSIRTWTTRDGEEAITLRRVGGSGTGSSTATPSADSEGVF